MAVADTHVRLALGGPGWWRRRRDAGRTERHAFAAAMGLTPLLWPVPRLPEEVARLAAVDFQVWMVSVVLSLAGSWSALPLWAIWSNVANPLTENAFWGFWPAMLVALQQLPPGLARRTS